MEVTPTRRAAAWHWLLLRPHRFCVVEFREEDEGMDLGRFKTQIRNICTEYDVAMLGVFGSVARGEDLPGSDVDLLVRFKKPVGLIELIRLEDKFKDTFGRPVDLGTEGGLHPLIESNVMRDLKILYEG